MPFDGKDFPIPTDLSTRIGRLMRLKKLLAKQDDYDQGSFHTCLWHAASHDRALLAAGLTPEPIENFADHLWGKSPDGSNIYKFFGLRSNDSLWSDDDVDAKQARLDKLIAREKAKVLA